MKKLVAILLAVCVVLVGIILYLVFADNNGAEEAPAAAETTAIPEIKTVDYDKLYKLYDSDDVVLTINGKDFTWGEYFHMLFTQTEQMTAYFELMAKNYNTNVSWTDPMDEGSDMTYAEFAVENTESNLLQLATIIGFAESNNVELSQENLEAIKEQEAKDIEAMCGEGATEEDFEKYLEEIYMPRKLYDDMNSLNFYYQENFKKTYGADSELVSDEDAMAFLEENKYLNANHILFMTVDPTTGEPLDEAAANEKKAKAEEVAKELQAIQDQEELLKRFAELKTELDEDSGKAYFPEGYVFTPGNMVAEFENACNELEEYKVSDPVKSSFGYHVIIRLPLDIDSVLEYSQGGTPMTAKKIIANTEYANKLQAFLESLEISYAEGFEKPSILDYIK